MANVLVTLLKSQVKKKMVQTNNAQSVAKGCSLLSNEDVHNHLLHTKNRALGTLSRRVEIIRWR